MRRIASSSRVVISVCAETAPPAFGATECHARSAAVHSDRSIAFTLRDGELTAEARTGIRSRRKRAAVGDQALSAWSVSVVGEVFELHYMYANMIFGFDSTCNHKFVDPS